MKTAEKDLILQSKGFRSIWYLWQYVDGENAQKFISSILEDDTNCLRFVCKMAGQWIGTDGRGWNFYSEDYKEYITDERIMEILNSYDKKAMFSEFSEVDLVKLASFACNYKIDKKYHANEEQVNEEQAMNKVKEWRKDGATHTTDL
jgi:hypothetical protein